MKDNTPDTMDKTNCINIRNSSSITKPVKIHIIRDGDLTVGFLDLLCINSLFTYSNFSLDQKMCSDTDNTSD